MGGRFGSHFSDFSAILVFVADGFLSLNRPAEFALSRALQGDWLVGVVP